MSISFSALTLLAGRQKGHPHIRLMTIKWPWRSSVGILVVVIWLELSTYYILVCTTLVPASPSCTDCDSCVGLCRWWL